MKKLLLLLVLTLGTTSYAQKRMTKSISTTGVEAVNFKLNQVFKTTINTHKGDDVKMDIVVSGENNEHVMVSTKKAFGTLNISTDLQPTYSDANDKLSAHKVISIEVTILVPENMRIYLISDISTLEVSGKYSSITVELNSGSCTVSDFNGNLKVNTIEGNILANLNNCVVEATSKNGEVNIDSLNEGEGNINFNSINGNILVLKKE